MKVMIACSDRNFKDKKHLFKAIDSFEYEISELVFMSSGKNDDGSDSVQKLAKEWAITNSVSVTPFKIDWNNIKVPGADVQTNNYGKYNKNAALYCKDQMLDYCDGLISIDETFDSKKAEKADKYVHVYKMQDNRGRERI